MYKITCELPKKDLNIHSYSYYESLKALFKRIGKLIILLFNTLRIRYKFFIYIKLYKVIYKTVINYFMKSILNGLIKNCIM